jgi:hypothetical protein
MVYKMNQYQSNIPEDIPKKVRDELIEYIETIPFIKHMVSSERIRGYAKDRPRYSSLDEDHEDNFFNDERIIVDITKPHMLEDMNYFRQRAIFFKKNGKYTNIPPNPNPKSEYANFWRGELYKWEHGVIRPSDGEWIPGYLYFYWNYAPIWLVEEDEKSKNKKRQKSQRVREFPKPWMGDYLFFHYIDQSRQRAMHGKLLKMRGCGWSFKAACISPCNMYIYKGSGMANFHLASEKTFLSGDKGVFGKVVDTLDWLAETTPLPRIKIVNSLRSMEIQLGYIDKYGNRKGNLSSVQGISLKDNPEKARGIRGPFIQYEEDGLFPDLETAWGVNREAVESGSASFGFMMAGGTGGTEGASFDGSRKLFYSPGGYNIYGVPNVYDKNVQGNTECGFFWGAYMNRHRCYDETNGEPDIIKALIEIIENRHTIAKNTSDPAALTQARAEKPITPQEAIMRVEGTIFPIGDLADYLNTIKPEEARFTAQHYVGDLIYDPVTGVKWKPNADAKPIRTANVERGKNREGSVEIFELPKTGSDNKIQAGRYIAGIDPIDADDGDSLFSILVMDLLTDRIVAEYTGRHAKAEQCYEIALKLCMFYNAQANYENNLKGLHSYFKFKNALHYLADTPEILKDMDMLKPSMANPKGTRSTKPINAWGRQLQVTWMLSQAYSQGEEPKLNIHTIRSIGYLEETIVWNHDGNFDRVSAANMLFILREDKLRHRQQLQSTETKTKNAWVDSKMFEGIYGNRSVKSEEKYKSIFDD